MFERFNDSARQVVVLAQDEARELSHNYIGTEHLLLGLLREGDGITASVFGSFNVTLEEVRAQVARIIGFGEELVGGQIPFTPRAKKVLELALREALSLSDKEIEPQHIFLGLLEEGQGVAAMILVDLAPLDAFAQAVAEARAAARPTFGSSPPPVAPRRIPLRSTTSVPRRDLAPLIVGWLLFAVALGVGLLIGWAIWS